MKRLTTLMIAGFLLATLLLPASANSGPTVVTGEPGLELMVEENCPIIVEHEALTFDFTDSDESWIPRCHVTAVYTMRNPTAEERSVTMAFPTIARVGDPAVSAVWDNGQPVDYTLAYGTAVTSTEAKLDLASLGLTDVLEQVTLSSPPEPEPGVLRTFTPVIGAGTSFADDRFYIRLSIRKGPGARLLHSGFSGGSYDAEWVELSSWYYPFREQEPLQLLELAGSAEYQIAAYETNNSKEPLEGVTFSRTEETTALQDYLQERASLSDAAYWRILAETLEPTLEQYGNAAPVSELRSRFSNQPRLTLALYTVVFAAGETREVTVESVLDGTMNRPSGYSQVGMTCTYTYLSEPARSWASFGALDITVIPQQNEPITSSIPALTLQDGVYTASLEGLPEENISFRFGEEATEAELQQLRRDGAQRTMRFLGLILLPMFLLLALLVGVVFLLRWLIRRRKRK